MPFLAGERITAGRLSQDADHVALATADPPTADVWIDWGSETITFPTPNVPVRVLASLTGRTFRSAASLAGANAKIQISFDGGVSWTEGVATLVSTGTVAGGGQRAGFATQAFREGTPTGTVIIKAQCMATATATTFANGALSAEIVPL